LEYYGRLGLPLRGHRDSGELPLSVVRGNIDYMQGNLRATLQLMVDCNDDALKQHLMTAGRNVTYISSVSQNQLIDAICVVIRRRVVTEAATAKFFSVMADKTTDFSRQEQLVLYVRYVKEHSVFECFCASTWRPI
jgi:Domain of unknown function (DUF4371)